MPDPSKAAPAPSIAKQKVAALLIVYLKALQQSPGTSDVEWKACEDYRTTLAKDLP